jgi:hypothetical protein
MTSPYGSRADGLWAITSYFNPMRSKRRLLNFRIFRERLNVPLVAVELSYGSEFELQEQDADILIQRRDGAVLWQKERLLNLALQALPNDCRKVAWLDCDIMFDTADWAESASRLLDHFAIIQIFKCVHYLSPHWTPAKDCTTEVEFTRPAAIFSIASGLPAAICVGQISDTPESACAKGLAWAVRREVVDQHGFFDACILGGGDTALASAAKCCFDAVMKAHYMNERQRERYTMWARPFYETVRGEIGHLDAQIYHIWHGDYRHRRRARRHEGLLQFQFDPFTDIAKDTNGCWRWATEKPEMHDYVRGYLSSRREDG